MAPMKDPNEKKLESSYVYYVESHLVKKFNDRFQKGPNQFQCLFPCF